MKTLSPKQANDLIRIRDHCGADRGETEDINSLLDIIDALKMGDSKKSDIPKLHGWSVIFRGNYKHSSNKAPICLYFFVVSGTYDEEKICDMVKQQYSGRNNLLDGFDIIDCEMHESNERVILTGTGIGD